MSSLKSIFWLFVLIFPQSVKSFMLDLTRDSTVPLVTELTLLRLQFSLLQGTFNPTTGTATIDSCLPCDAGSFCKQPGLNATEGKCFAGYYCTGRSPSPTPVSSYQCV